MHSGFATLQISTHAENLYLLVCSAGPKAGSASAVSVVFRVQAMECSQAGVQDGLEVELELVIDDAEAAELFFLCVGF